MRPKTAHKGREVNAMNHYMMNYKKCSKCGATKDLVKNGHRTDQKTKTQLYYCRPCKRLRRKNIIPVPKIKIDKDYIAQGNSKNQGIMRKYATL